MNDQIFELDADVLAEQWHRFRLAAFRRLQAAVAKAEAGGVGRQEIAARLGMDKGQLSRILSGQRNVTLRTMHNIARAIDARLELDVVSLAGLNRPNYSYDDGQPLNPVGTASGNSYVSAEWFSL